jgi:hypothetical protein
VGPRVSLDCSQYRCNPCPANDQSVGRSLDRFNQTRHPVTWCKCRKCWDNRPLRRPLYTFSDVLQTVELLLHQTQSLYNQRLEVNWWHAERQACIPRRFYFITQETVNKMYESYRRIILKRDQKKERKECVNTEENKKLGVSSFTSFYLCSPKGYGASTLIARSRAS